MKLIDCVTYIFIPIRKNNIAFVSKQ
ncbi:MAG: hypothetical protein RL060_1764, partial [Bacteroidota bacterium]